MELTRTELFKAKNDRHENLKNCDGLVICPVAYVTYTYEDSNGKEHAVLVIKNSRDGQMYRTEVKAFIEKFMTYLESFGDCPDDEKPLIVVKLNESKKGNKYVNFDLMDDEK